jgi:cobalt-zinc-cadmium efflux system outer membrane protein
LLYYEYYLVHRALEVNQENLKLLQEARRTAEARVRTGQSPQQELLQIEVELGKQRERELILRRTLTVTKARINALLHRLPDDPLPPPVSQLVPAADLPPLEQLYSSALLHRPDLKAARQRLEAEQLSLALAEREYYPDLEVMAAYDAFWQERPLRTMIGFGVNLPVQLSRRRAALAESLARITRRQAELNRLTDQIHLQVRDAYTRVEENSQLLQLYDKQLIPAAQANVREAVAAYTAGRIPLLGLLEAQRNLVQLRDRYFEILADYYRSRASLERAVGAPLIHDEKATHNHP